MKTRTSLSPSGVRLLTRLADEGRSTFSTADAIRLVGGTPGTTHALLSRLVGAGWVARAERGHYSVIPMEAGTEGVWAEEPFIVATELASPSAVSHWSAAAYWNLTEQVVNTVFVSTTQRKFSPRQVIGGVPVRFVLRPEQKFFGVVRERLRDTLFPITSLEKTLVDMLEQPHYSGGITEAAKALKIGYDENRIDANAFEYALERLGNGAVVKRAGYLLEVFGVDTELGRRLERRLTGGDTLLNPLAERSGERSTRWRLWVNTAHGDLVNWQEH